MSFALYPLSRWPPSSFFTRSIADGLRAAASRSSLSELGRTGEAGSSLAPFAVRPFFAFVAIPYFVPCVSSSYSRSKSSSE